MMRDKSNSANKAQRLKVKNSTSKTVPEHAPDKHSSEHEAEHSESVTKSVTLQKLFGATGILLVWIVIIVAGIWIGTKIIKNVSNSKKTAQTESVKAQYHWKIERTIKISFTSEYGEIYRGVGPGTMTSSQNATVPYFIKNRAGEFKMQKSEDFFLTTGNSNNNNELQFKSQNCESGSIEIVFWVWTKY